MNCAVAIYSASAAVAVLAQSGPGVCLATAGFATLAVKQVCPFFGDSGFSINSVPQSDKTSPLDMDIDVEPAQPHGAQDKVIYEFKKNAPAVGPLGEPQRRPRQEQGRVWNFPETGLSVLTDPSIHESGSGLFPRPLSTTLFRRRPLSIIPFDGPFR
ncbi:hypothetical protein M885DRAFT_309328 [Pelagophyceae sp. CCMP2097]|nr:hypothetical protein M885DRAFT_309328 [Pelagophyceae sp. CCMP2097]